VFFFRVFFSCFFLCSRQILPPEWNFVVNAANTSVPAKIAHINGPTGVSGSTAIHTLIEKKKKFFFRFFFSCGALFIPFFAQKPRFIPIIPGQVIFIPFIPFYSKE
jgi:hypothetical protein